MINLRLAKEYLAPPIFCSDLEQMGHVDLEELPISNDLRSDILKWNIEYQSTFNNSYPPDSGFDSSEAEHDHVVKGAELAGRLQKELGEEYTVVYKP